MSSNRDGKVAIMVKNGGDKKMKKRKERKENERKKGKKKKE